jgi:hypothetical protein
MTFSPHLALSLSLAASLGAAPVSKDIVIYGGTPGGITAAVQASRDGRSVVLVSPTKHLGGLTTSGLGWTDLGDSSILGGLGLDFYKQVYRHYQSDSAWTWQTRDSFGNRGQGGQAFNPEGQIGSVFEPKVAEEIFTRMLAEAKVEVIHAKLDLKDGVKMEGKRISALRMEDGREFAGKMFIDASYEGDLLPGAKVSFTVGRESNGEQDETTSGIQAAQATKNQLPDGIDPHRVKGNPASGLLPGVNAEPGGADGSGDRKLQAYCYRMVLTDVPENRVAIGKPFPRHRGRAGGEVLQARPDAEPQDGFKQYRRDLDRLHRDELRDRLGLDDARPRGARRSREAARVVAEGPGVDAPESSACSREDPEQVGTVGTAEG